MTKATKNKTTDASITENLLNDKYLTRVLSLQETIRIAADIMLTKYEESSCDIDPDDVAQVRDFT